MHERYMDLHESGEATVNQQNKLFKYEEERNHMKEVLDEAERLLNIKFNHFYDSKK